jgi:hypothetical protein
MGEEYIEGIGQETAENIAGLTANQAILLGINAKRAEHNKQLTNSKKINLTKPLKMLGKALPIAGIPLAVEDAYSGVKAAGDIFATSTPSFAEQAVSGAAGVAHGLTFGVVPTKEAARGLGNLLLSPKVYENTLKTPTKEEMAAAMLLHGNK